MNMIIIAKRAKKSHQRPKLRELYPMVNTLKDYSLKVEVYKRLKIQVILTTLAMKVSQNPIVEVKPKRMIIVVSHSLMLIVE